MKAIRLTALGLVIALGAGVATAQGPYGPGPQGWGPGAVPGYPGGGLLGRASRVWLDVETQSERDLVFVGIRYAGILPEELKITPTDGDLLIHVERSAQQQGPRGRTFAGSHTSRRVGLPAGADVARMQRQDGPGFVTLLIPRTTGRRW